VLSPKQGTPIPRNASYYKSKGFQVFPEYGLAIKASCLLEDISRQMSGDNDLAYGCIQNENSNTLFIMTQLIVKRVPEGYMHASSSQKVEVENKMLSILGGERIVFLGQNAVLKNYTNRGFSSRSISMIKKGSVYTFNMSTNNDLNGNFNRLTNSIKFY
jgi:hypothetical protein